MLFKKCGVVGLSCVYEENETKENGPTGLKPSVRNLSRDRKSILFCMISCGYHMCFR